MLDTNVLASGFAGSGAPSDVLRAWLERRFLLIVSANIIAELGRTFEQPYFSQRLSLAQREANLDLLRRRARTTPITTAIQGVATHPEDDRILAAALSAGVQYLVTGDRQLQALGSFRDVTIISPRQFLDVLAG